MTFSEVIHLLRAKLGEQLVTQLSEADDEKSFLEIGVDSVIATELMEFIRQELDPDLSVSVLFDFPSVRQLAHRLTWQERKSPVKPETQPSGVDSEVVPKSESSLPAIRAVEPAEVGRGSEAVPCGKSYEPIAVVGLSGRFPGADNVEELWQNLAAGVCSTTEIPIERSRYWDLADLASQTGRSCFWGGFINEVERFDPLFFSISPSEASVMDPQQRLFLEEAWKSIETAGIAGDALSESRCGVYVGLMNTDYENLLTQAHALTPKAHELTGIAGSILASRIAYHLNLRGPAIAVDTACSSSMVAIHLACRALQLGEIDMALAGGVTLYLTQKRYNLMEQAGMLTSSGKCRPFDDAADGMVPGEAVGVVVLKRLEDAVRDGDSISGVIVSSGTNQAGKTNGITAPSRQSQIELATEVYRRGDIDPGSIQYIEAHGTGTRLGDPIELEALATVFQNPLREGQFCRLGSLKANLGHPTAAAGVVGLIKVLLALKHRAIPPQIHFVTPNRHAAGLDGPFRINTALEPWEPEVGKPRRAAVNASGFSGTNSHLVIEEAPVLPERTHPGPATGLWIILSAKTLRALERKAAELSGWLLSKGGQVSLVDLSFTLSTGRSAFEERLAFAARDLAEVRAGLQQFLGSTNAGLCLWRGKATADAPKPSGFTGFGAAWVSGTSVDWTIHYQGLEPRRIHLPVYPFERERYWYDTLQPSPLSNGAASPSTSEGAAAISAVEHGEENRETRGRVRLKDLSSNPAAGYSAENSAPAGPSTSGDHSSRKIDAPHGKRQSQEAQAEEIPRVQATDAQPSPGTRKEVAETADVVRRLRQLVAKTLCVEQSRIPDAKRLAELGLDSILAVELAKRISGEFQINLPAARLYDHPSVQHLASYVSQVCSADPVEQLDSPSLFFPTQLPLAASCATAAGDLSDRWTGRCEANHPAFDTDRFTRRIRSLVALTLFIEEHKIDEGKKFADLGLDSILAVELVKRLSGEFGVNLSASALYSHVTTRQLAVHIGELLSGKDKGQESNVDRFVAPEWANGEADGPPLAPTALSVPATGGTQRHDSEAAKPSPGSRVEEVRRIMITGSGSIADLRFLNETGAVPGSHEVQISVKAASVMLADLLCARGLYPTMPSYPFTPGFEVAGTVVQVGGEPGDLRPGDRVCGLTGAKLGGHADLVNVDPRLLVRIPEALTFSEACTLPVSFLTARYALLDVGRLAPGEVLLIHSAASCTGLMAIQLARRAGAQIIATVGSEEKVAYLRGLGVDKVFNYRSKAAMTELPAGLPGGQVNVILNLLTGPIRDQSLGLLAPEGRFLDLAVAGLKAAAPPNLSALVDNQGYFGLDCRRLCLRQPAYVGRSLQLLSELVNSGEIQPLPVIRQYALSDAKAAYELLESRNGIGRVVLMPGGGTGSVSSSEDQMTHRMSVRETSPAPAFEPIAVIGISGRFPGARDLDSFWQNLVSAKSSIKEVPSDRWPFENFGNGGPQPGKDGYYRWGGFLDGIDEFDPSFFNMARGEAEVMDPQHRLFLQEAWKVLEDSGHSPRELAGRPCGVFVGIGPSDYYAQIQEPDAHSLTGNIGSGLAGRVAYLLDWTGPCLAVETACSSSFSALHLACASLGRRECDLALAGGVHLATSSKVFLATTRMGLLSPTGRCRTFDAAADGWVVSEGVGAVILKRLDDAVRDTDHIYGVIRGCCINHDGAKNGFTSPKAASQAALQRRVYQEAGIHPETVDYVELHGTSSLLGDEIELLALKESFGHFTKKEGFCAIGSLKPNIGHSIAAAGISCLLKVLLALRHRQLPPLAGLEKVNEALGLDGSPFYLNTRLTPWKQQGGRPRRAAINGLSASGTNCHLIVEEYIPESGQISEISTEPSLPSLVVLSARDNTRLRESASKMIEFLERNPDLRLFDVAFTLQTGRQEMEERLAFTASSLAEANHKLAAFLGGETVNASYRGHVEGGGDAVSVLVDHEEDRQLIAAAIRNRSLDKLARLWTTGIEMDWSLLDLAGRPKRVPLPTYPFARERYWLQRRKTSNPVGSSAAPPAMPRHRETGSSERSGSAAPKPFFPETDLNTASDLLRDIIAEVLRCLPTEIDPNRDLFRYGFGSLHVLRVADQFEAATGIHLPGRAFFECRTIRELARTAIDRAEVKMPGANQADCALGAKKDGFGQIGNGATEPQGGLRSFPLSEGQKALWSIQQSNPETTEYHVPVAMVWDDPLDLAALEQAWKQLVQEQPALRTTIRFDVTEPVQMIHEPKSVVIHHENLGGLPDTEIIRRIREANSKPFDLERDPLWRAYAFSITSSRSILLFSLHHLVFDGHSLGFLLREVERRYREIRSGFPVASRTIAKSVADYVQIERCYLASEAFQEDRAYWLRQFPNGFTRLGLGEAKAKDNRGRGDVFRSAISETVVHALGHIAVAESVTLQAVFLTAFEALLAIVGGKPEVVAGTAVDLRPSTGFEEVIGYFVNVLPIPAAISSSGSFRDLLRQVFGQLLDSLEHRRLPFRQLVRALAEEDRDPGELQAAFYFQSWSSPEERRLVERLVPEIHQTGEFDLVFEVMEAPKDWLLNVKYRTNAFEPGTIESLANQYREFLAAVARNPDQRLSELQPAENRGFAGWSANGFNYPRERCVHRLIEDQVLRTPDATAVLCLDQQLNYRDLDARSNQLAHLLMRSGASPGSLVGVMLDRSLELPACLLAVWKIGAAYVPLDPSHPTERIEYILSDACVQVLLTQSGCRFRPRGIRAIEIDRAQAAIGQQPVMKPVVQGSPEDLAYVIYTSGSTGKPKGVQIAHRSLTHFLWSMAERPGCTPDDYVLATTTICFDIAALELFLPLVTGARVEILPEEIVKNGLRLKDKIENSPATLIQGTPATWKMLLAAELGPIPRVKALCGGEAWDDQLAEQLLARTREVWNMYGPTETTVWSSIQKVAPGRPVCLGDPIGNTQFHVFDESMRPVQPGEIGELFIGGDGLAKGYLNRPELTRERFVPNPLRPEEVIYRTGDLVRYV